MSINPKSYFTSSGAVLQYRLIYVFCIAIYILCIARFTSKAVSFAGLGIFVNSNALSWVEKLSTNTPQKLHLREFISLATKCGGLGAQLCPRPTFRHYCTSYEGA